MTLSRKINTLNDPEIVVDEKYDDYVDNSNNFQPDALLDFHGNYITDMSGMVQSLAKDSISTFDVGQT